MRIRRATPSSSGAIVGSEGRGACPQVRPPEGQRLQEVQRTWPPPWRPPWRSLLGRRWSALPPLQDAAQSSSSTPQTLPTGPRPPLSVR